jgi:membrane protein
VDAITAPLSSRTTAASTCEEISVRSASALAASIGETLTEPHTAAVRRPLRQPIAKFYRDRGPHLAAMIAYFGLLSSVSLIFLALALFGFTGRADESSYLVKELQRLFPSQSITDIVSVVEAITSNATTLGLLGGAFLVWTSLSLFSVLESAFNIVYARPNRSFLRGKFLATLFMAGSLIVLFIALVVGSIGFDLLKRFAPGFVANGVVAYGLSVLVSTLAVFVFLVVAYERLTNATLTLREVWPGAAIGAIMLQGSFQVLPLFVRLSNEVVAVQALGASALLLVWLYVMSNAIVFGAEVNWWWSRRDEEEVAGLA